MQKTTVQQAEIKLLGITCRTNNAELFKESTTINKIAATVQKYFQAGIAATITNRENPHTTYCVYTKYASDYNGDYTYFIGEQVSSFAGAAAELEQLTIPAQNYIKFTNGPAPMPDVCISTWQQIWSMSDTDLGGTRSYIADIEVYDQRSYDPLQTTLDIYIGITS